MFWQFFRTTFRIFIREGFYSILNIVGLSTGITVALIILLYLQQDLTYDRWHKNARNIYRVNSIFVSSGKENKFAMSPVAFGPRIMEEYPEVRSFVRIANLGRVMLNYGEERYSEQDIVVADSTVFGIFTFPFIQGDPVSCFRSPNSIVLTESLARKIFKGRNPLGETLIMDKKDVFQVSGIVYDLPDNVHHKISALIPIKRYDPHNELINSSFYNIQGYTYLLLPDNYDTRLFYDKFPAFYEKYAAKDGIAFNQQYKAVIQPFLNIHFSRGWQYDLPNGNRTYTFAFLIIGLLVLSLACINYLNMTTARAERRKREIAAKKILGSNHWLLLVQFLGESMFMAILAMLLAMGMTQCFLDFTSLNQIMDKNLQLEILHNPYLWIGIPALTLIVGLTSGLYPAVYLSRVHPLSMIHGNTMAGKSGGVFRKLLVVTQMVISIGVIICTLLIDRQIQYVRSRNLGINTENLLILPLRDTLISNHMETFREKLLQNTNIQSVTTAYNMPPDGLGNNLYRAESSHGMEEHNFFTLFASYDFIKTMAIQLVQGRDFSRDISTDFRSAFIINETVARYMGWDEPLGKRLQQNFGSDGVPFFDGTVIGIIRDFNFTSLHDAIEPMVLRLQGQEGGQLLVRLNGLKITECMKYIESTWSRMGSEFPTDYRFLDQDFDDLYRRDRQQNSLIKVFSWICILISCLGLLSLSSYITEIRNREMVIRKVLGAPMFRLTLMIYWETLALVLVSMAIASPLAFWLTDKLLRDFAYRSPLSIYVFVITLSGAILIALATVSYHSIKTARSDPARSLKFE